MMLKDFTILYVEDEEMLLTSFHETFKYIFKEVLLAENGEIGLQKFQQNIHNIDIIVTDINMPKMDGLEMCEQIRKINQNIPIIITTAFKDKSFLFKAIDMGVSKFVTKPVNFRNLSEDIHKALEPKILKRQLQEEESLHLEQMIESAKFSATGKLAAGIVHEINTPLTFIKANVEMLEYDINECKDIKSFGDIKQSLDDINEGISRITNIINSMSEVINQNDKSFVKSEIYSTLITVLRLVWNKFKHYTNIYINGEKFDIKNSHNDTHTFYSNIQKERIEQVWIIILNNALDELLKIQNYNDRKIEIFLFEDESHINVLFKDNAGGIDDTILDQLFNAFKGTKSSSGMGVGLSIAKKIIDEHEGATIEAYNEEKKAVFRVKLLKV